MPPARMFWALAGAKISKMLLRGAFECACSKSQYYVVSACPALLDRLSFSCCLAQFRWLGEADRALSLCPDRDGRAAEHVLRMRQGSADSRFEHALE